MISEKLTDGEVTDGSVTTDVFPNSTRTYGYPRFARRFTEASSSASMVAQRRGAMVSPTSLVMVSLGEHCYDIYKP